jgi:hypothetical protein
MTVMTVSDPIMTVINQHHDSRDQPFSAMQEPETQTSQAWPAKSADCHEIMDDMHQTNAFLLASLNATRDIVAKLEQDRRLGSHGDYEKLADAELTAFLTAARRIPVEDVAQLLVLPGALRHEFERLRTELPLLYARLRRDTWNSHDDRMSKLRSGPVRQLWERRVDRTLHALMIATLRKRNSKLIFCLTLCRSMVLEHQHIPNHTSDNLTREQITYDSTVVNKCRRALKDWIPVLSFKTTNKFVAAAIDNLDAYDKKAHTRIRNGQCVTSHMIHAVVGERLMLDEEIFKDAGPAPVGDMLIADTVQVVKSCALPSEEAVHEYLGFKWHKYMAAAATVISPTEMLARPPASEDRQTSGKTICVSLPILVGRSTASKVDVAAAIDSVRKQFPGAKLMLFMDYQTFAVAWWLKARTPKLYEDVIVVGGELHRQFHTDDCVYRLWWEYVLEPAAMWLYRKDIRQGFNADKYNNKETFVRLVTIAGLTWLSRLTSEEDPIPSDPVKLMEEVKKNLPVWEFISFLLYAGVFALSDKAAMRTAHISELDWAWSWTSILARACGKTNYAKYGVLMNLVLHSSHPWVRAVLDKDRTHRSSNLPCTGIGKEAAIEHSVRAHKSAMRVVSEHRLSAVNVAMTALRENASAFHSYLDVPDRKPSKQTVLDEDIEALVEQFGLSFGTTFQQLKSPEVWSDFAMLGVVKSKCGASHIQNVWAGIPAWVQRLTTSCDGQPAPMFEPADVEGPEYIDLNSDDDDDDGDDGDAGGSDGDDPWVKKAAVAWIKKHGGKADDPIRLEQVKGMLGHSSRRKHLFQKRAAEEHRIERQDHEASELAAVEAAERRAAAGEVEWDVEAIKGRRVVEGEVEYRVKWLNYDEAENSWEPAEGLKGSEMLIAAFEEKFKSKKTPTGSVVVRVDQYTQGGKKRGRSTNHAKSSKGAKQTKSKAKPKKR